MKAYIFFMLLAWLEIHIEDLGKKMLYTILFFTAYVRLYSYFTELQVDGY